MNKNDIQQRNIKTINENPIDLEKYEGRDT